MSNLCHFEAPPSFMKMGGSDGRQEGNYASFEPSISGRLLLQNDLGLTLPPESQIERTGEILRKATTKDHHHGSEIGTLANISVNGTELQLSENPRSHLLERDCEAVPAVFEQSHGIGQAVTYCNGRGGAIVGDQSRLLGPQESPSCQQDILYKFTNGRLRYSQKVRPLRNPAPEDKARSKSRTEKPQRRDANGERFISRASPPDENEASTPPKPSPLNDKRTLPAPSRTLISQSPTGSSSLSSSTTAQRVRSSTSFYPRCSKQRLSPTENPGLNNSSSPQSSGLTNKPSREQGSNGLTRARAINMLQEELKNTKQALFQKTRANSDSKHAIYGLSKAYDGLLVTVNAHLDIQAQHIRLLEEHRRLLKSYDSLAEAHAACRSTSSRKLAQRIIDAAPPLRQAAYPYPSPSPSTTAHLRYNGSYSNSNAAVDSPLPATPLIDLTRSPSPASAPPLQSGCTNPAPFIEQGDQSGNGGDANYANVNGFDEEANEMFEALWESEMANFSVADGEASKV